MLQFEEVCKHIYIFPYTKIPPDHERLVITGMESSCYSLNSPPLIFGVLTEKNPSVIVVNKGAWDIWAEYCTKGDQ